MSLDLATIGIAMDTSGLDKGTRSLKEAEKAADRTADAADRTGNSLRGMSSYADLASKALASIGLGAAVTQFMRVADSVTQLNNALKLSTGSAKQAEQAYSALYEIAQRSRVSFIELGQTFTSLNRAGQEMGVSQQRMLAVTEAVGNAMAISGGSAQSMQAALVQLGQGMSSGVLRGEELNSVMEQAPRLAKALADGLNVPIGKLREMGAAGQITAEQVVRALESQSAVLSKEVAGATLTVGQAFTKLTNASTNAVGEFDKASGASTSLANAVSSIATAMDGMGTAFKDNEAIIKTVMGALAGAAALATLAAIPAAITAIGTALAGLGAILAAPAAVPLLALLGIGALAGGISAYNSAQAKTEEGIRKTIAAMEDMNKRGPSIYARDAESMAKWEAGVAQRKQQIAGLRQELALLSAKGIDTSAEDARLARHTANAKAAKADADAVAKLTQELSGIPTGYTERMAEIIRLNQKGALVGKDYTDALAAMQTTLLKKTGATKDATRAEHEAARAAEEQAKLVAELGGLQSSFAKDWANLNALYAARKLTTEQLTAAQAALLEKQPAIKAAADEENKAQDLLTKSYQHAAAERLKNVESMEQIAPGLVSQNQALRDEIELIGLTEEQQTRVLQLRNEAIILTKEATLAELERASAITGTMTREQIALAAEIEALKERNELLGAKSVKNTAAEAAKKAADEWQRAADDINRSLTDALMRGFESGKDFAKNMRDTVVNMFKTMVLRPTISAILAPVAGGVTGLLGLSGAANAGQASAATGGIGGASGVLSGLSGLGSALGVGLGAGFSSIGAAGIGGWLSAGTSLIGTGTLGGIGAGLGLLAGPVGGVLAIGGLLSSLFGDDDPRYKFLTNSSNTNPGKLFEDGVFVKSAYGNIGFDDYAKNIDANESRETFQAIAQLDNAIAAALSPEQNTKIKAALNDYTSEKNASTEDYIKGRLDIVTQTIGGALGELAGMFSGTTDQLASYVVELVNAQKLLLPALADLGAFGDLDAAMLQNSQSALKLAYALQTTFGSTDNAMTALQSYYANFYSEQERAAAATQKVSDAFAQLGLAMPTTREAFRDLTNEYLAMGIYGAETAAVLLGLSGAFASVTQTTEAAAQAERERASTLRGSFGALAQSLADMRGGVADADARVAASRMSIWEGYNDAQQKVIDLEMQAAEATRSFAQSLRSFIGDMATGPQSSMGLESRYRTLQQQLQQTAAQAGAGDQGARDRLTGVASSYLDAARARSSTSVDYARDAARVRVMLGNLASTAEADPLVKKYDAESLTIQQQIADAQIDVVKYLALMEATGTSTDLGIQSVDKTLSEMRDEYIAAEQAQAAANLKLDVALAALDALGLTESLVNAIAANQTSSLSGALNISDEALGSITGALGLTPENVAELGQQFAVEVALLVGQAATDLASTLQSALAFDPAVFDALRTVVGYDTASPDFAALQTILGFDLESEKFRALGTILGLAPGASAQVDALVGGIGFTGDAAAQAAALTAGLAFTDAAREQIALIAAGVSLTDAAGAQADGLNAGVGWAGDVGAQVDGLNSGIALTGGASEQVNALLAGLTLSGPASEQVDGLLDGLKLAAADRVTIERMLVGIGFDTDTAAALHAGLGLQDGLLSMLGSALGLSADAVNAIGVLSGIGTIDQVVRSAYSSIGRSGIGSGVNQIDQGGYDYWTAMLSSGRVSQEDFLPTFLQNAADDARRDEDYAALVGPYLKKLGIPGFAVGTNYVPYDMIAQIHEGEAIVPKAYNPAAGGTASSGSNAEMVAELRAMRAELAELRAIKSELAAINRSSSTTATGMTGIVNKQVSIVTEAA